MSRTNLLAGIKILGSARLMQSLVGVKSPSDMGAEFIKVKRPGEGAWEGNWAGGNSIISGVNVLFLPANRNRKSTKFNLKNDLAKNVVQVLI